MFGGKLTSYDEAKIARMPGVKRVVRSTTRRSPSSPTRGGSAKTALDALPIVWDEGANASASARRSRDILKEGLTATEANGERKKAMR